MPQPGSERVARDPLPSWVSTAPKSSLADIARALKADLKNDPPDTFSLTTPGTDPANPRGAQVQSPGGPPRAVPVPETAPPVAMDPSVLLRATGTEVVKESGSLRRVSGDSGEISAADQAPAASPSAGFFGGIVRDMIGLISGTGAKTPGPLTQGSEPSVPPEPVSGTGSEDSSPDLSDAVAQPARKASGPRQEDSRTVSAADAPLPAREQADFASIRSVQSVASGPVTSGKSDSSAPAVRELPSPYAPLPPEVSHRIADQVVQNLKLQVDGTSSEIRMTLKPPSLGDVQLSVHVEDSKMQAQINVSQQVVKAALEAHMPQLRAALQEHGIEVQRIDVMLPESSLQQGGPGQHGDRTGRRSGRRSATGIDAESYEGMKDMGYNTIELIM
ncbi:MAG TPA: flagellar hook-length control protein FliK [Bacteroidota bacterium]|nr:flagellar hook-length control protein FliK [Bacteroidota bacterium]